MSENQEKPNTDQTDPKPQPSPQPIPLMPMFPQAEQSAGVSADRIDEITDYLVACRSPNIFDTRAPFIVVPEGLKVLDVEKHMPVPSRIRKDVIFTESESFTHYFGLFKDSYKPRLFSTIDSSGIRFLTVFDYDGPGVVANDEEGKPTGKISATHPQWNSHKARLHLNYHRDYQTLRNADSKWFDQEDFALFIEENTHLFVQPDGATMLELAQDLKGHRNVGWKSGKRLADGRVQLEFIEEIETKTTRGDMQVPESLILRTPIFEGFAAQDLKVAFRYRLDGNGGVAFSYRLLTKLAERAAEEEVKKTLIEKTGLPVYAVASFDGITKASN